MKADPAGLEVKLATEDWEIEQIHRLNHRTFAEEIPQHAPRPDGRLVDRFHATNRYVIVRHDQRVVGMMALRWQRPFSLDAKLPDLDRFLPAGCRPAEGRLLAVEPAYRRTAVFAALCRRAAEECIAAGFDLAVISGTTRQLKLYRHLGFTAFGPLVGTAAASYQPMLLPLAAYLRTVDRSPALRAPPVRPPGATAPLNLLPGPVCTTARVDAAFAAPAISHRGPAFHAQLAAVRARLRALTGARDVQVLPGSGSLANSVIAQQLALRPAPGLVLANGEFGGRLASEARRAGLGFSTLQAPDGGAFDLAEVETEAARLPPGGWLWCVHHETSTGRLNPLAALKHIATRHGIRLCVDCISSLGAVPVDLRGVHLAAGTSGKGLGAYPGLALVFHEYEPQPEPARLPGYLDLGHWAAHGSVPHTHSSNLVAALEAALGAATPERMIRIREKAAWLRAALRAHGFNPVVPDDEACSGVITFPAPGGLDSGQLGEELERRGYLLSFRSPHLLAHNQLQVALLGDPPRAGLENMLLSLAGACEPACMTPASALAFTA